MLRFLQLIKEVKDVEAEIPFSLIRDFINVSASNSHSNKSGLGFPY